MSTRKNSYKSQKQGISEKMRFIRTYPEENHVTLYDVDTGIVYIKTEQDDVFSVVVARLDQSLAQFKYFGKEAEKFWEQLLYIASIK
jgi:hypothetical protein